MFRVVERKMDFTQGPGIILQYDLKRGEFRSLGPPFEVWAPVKITASPPSLRPWSCFKNLIKKKRENLVFLKNFPKSHQIGGFRKSHQKFCKKLSKARNFHIPQKSLNTEQSKKEGKEIT
jgi:hypothetical protein